jgi:hypothetical protein
MLFTSGGLFGSYSRLTINKSITYRWFLLVRGLRFIKLCSECGGSSDPAVLLGIGQCKFADCARFFWSPQPPAWLRLSDPAWPISRSFSHSQSVARHCRSERQGQRQLHHRHRWSSSLGAHPRERRFDSRPNYFGYSTLLALSSSPMQRRRH